MPDSFYRQMGFSAGTIIFAVALAVFIFAAATGVVQSLQAWLLFATSFLLMLRFWWRYNELFVQHLPSRNYWHFLFDFAAAFFSILSVIFVNNIQTWAMLGALAMLSSAIRCGLSWNAKGDARQKLRRTLFGAIGMLIIFALAYMLAPVAEPTMLAAAVFIIVLVFVVYSSRKP